MNNRFFKNTVTLFLYNKDFQAFDKFIVKNVYFRHAIKNQMSTKGLERVSSGTVTLPIEFVEINADEMKDYNLDSFLNKLFESKTWNLIDKSYVVENEVKENLNYKQLLEKYRVFRIIGVSDNRKGNLQHIKLEVNE